MSSAKGKWVELEVKTDSLESVQKRLGVFRKKAPKAMTRAINRALDSMRGQAVKAVNQKFYFRRGERLKKKMFKIKRATYQNANGSLNLSTARLALPNFKTNPKDETYSHTKPPKYFKGSLLKSKGAARWPGIEGKYSKAFVARVKAGKTGSHLGVFERVLGSKTEKGKDKLKQFYGLSMSEMVDGENKMISRHGQSVYQKRLDHEIKRILSSEG